jgi:hypothetical protein
VNTEPVVLLPLRLETRYSTDGTVLRVRIFPDDIHVDALDRGVDDGERVAGEAYWTAIWDADPWLPPADAGVSDPWAALIARVGQRRAPWVAEALRPTNEPDRPVSQAQRPGPPPVFPVVGPRTHPAARVATLPRQFRAYAFTDEATPRVADGAPLPDVLAVGPPADSSSGPMTFAHGAPVLGEDLRWLVDFEEALRVGMGIVIPLARAGQPVQRLIVVGVRDDLDPAAGAARLADLFQTHAYTDGADFVPQGSPTNNTDTDRSAWSKRAAPRQPGWATVPPAGSDAAVLAGLLDLPADTFDSFDHAALAEQPGAAAMTSALWGTTWEVIFAKLTHPATPGRSFTAVQREALRNHAIAFVRGRGPAPAIRVGAQPYGILPATDLTRYAPATAGITDAGLSSFLINARRLWRAGVADVPTVMSGDLEQAMPEILGSSPVMESLRVRSLTKVNKCYEPLPFLLGAQDNCTTQDGLDTIIHEFLGFDPTELESNGVLGKASRALAMPLVDGNDAAYIDQLLANGSPSQGETSVLQALLGLAATVEAGEWSSATGDDGITKLSENVQAAAQIVDADAVRGGLHAMLQFDGGPDAVAAVASANAALASSSVPRFDAGRIQATYPIDAIRPTALVTAATRRHDVLLTDPTMVVQLSAEVLRRFGRRQEFRAALQTIRDLPDDERDLLLREVLDCASHRLDAWVTSLATNRLSGQRAAGIRGLTLGAYGFVENIAPRPIQPAPVPPGFDAPNGQNGHDGQGADPLLVNPREGGYVHAPSLDQATTAGLLRSARLTHDPGDTGSPALDIDLSSARVRTALHVIDGVRQGQPLGALLGYRLERRLHELSGSGPSESGLELDRYVYVLRSIAPLRAAKLTDPESGVVDPALESVAAANVVDGVRLLDLAAAPGGEASISTRLTHGPDDALVTTYIGTWAPPGSGEVAAVLQAIRDLAHVNDAVADLLLAESVHQLARGNTAGASAALDAAGGGDAMPPDPEVVTTPRGGTALTHRLLVLAPATAPGVTGWDDSAPLAQAHPRMEAWARTQLGSADRIVLSLNPESSVADLGGCALQFVLESGPVFRSRLAADPLATRPPGWGRGTDRLILAEAEQLAYALRSLLASARPITDATVAAPGEGAVAATGLGYVAPVPPRRMDLAGLRARAVAARATIAGPPAPAPGSPDANRLAAADAAISAADSATSDAERLHHLDAALLAVFGPGLPALPELAPPAAPDQLAAALEAAGGNQPSALSVGRWLSGWAPVRPGPARFVAARAAREALGGRSGLRVLQLPAVPGETWIGLPFTDGVLPKGPRIGLVAELPGGLVPAADDVLAGFVVDEWVDLVPSPTAVTGVALNADAPDARPPQAVLVAVTPDGRPWDLDKLRGVVDDTVRLAQERAVTLERVPLAPRLLPALYVDDWSLQGQPAPVLVMSAVNAHFLDPAYAPKFVK